MTAPEPSERPGFEFLSDNKRLRQHPRGTTPNYPSGRSGAGNRCAPFCAPPTSRTIALSDNWLVKQIARTSTENQCHSKPPHSVAILDAATVNRRVASSNLARGAISYHFANLDETPPARKSRWQVFADGQSHPPQSIVELPPVPAELGH
jgi:hypothetical protein